MGCSKPRPNRPELAQDATGSQYIPCTKPCSARSTNSGIADLANPHPRANAPAQLYADVSEDQPLSLLLIGTSILQKANREDISSGVNVGDSTSQEHESRERQGVGREYPLHVIRRDLEFRCDLSKYWDHGCS